MDDVQGADESPDDSRAWPMSAHLAAVRSRLRGQRALLSRTRGERCAFRGALAAHHRELGDSLEQKTRAVVRGQAAQAKP